MSNKDAMTRLLDLHGFMLLSASFISNFQGYILSLERTFCKVWQPPKAFHAPPRGPSRIW